jgi:hypothetical protein
MVQRFLKRFIVVKRIRGWYQSRRNFNWDSFLQIDNSLLESAFQSSKRKPGILLVTSMGAYTPATLLDSLLAVALSLRGADVHILLCDSALPACQLCDIYFYPNQKKFIQHGPKKDLCKNCFTPAYKMFSSLGVNVHRYSDFLTQDDIKNAEQTALRIDLKDIGNYKPDGIAIGEHALAGTLRFYARGDLNNEPYAQSVLRRYLTASVLSTYAIKRFLRKFDIECASFHHGIYVPQGLIGEVCRIMGVRVVNWHVAYRKKCFIFSHDNTYHHTLMSEPTTKWRNIDLTPQMDNRIMDYLKTRWYGTKDWIWFHESPEFDLKRIANELNVDFSKPCIGMLTSVMWDAQLHYPSNAFPNMLDWVLRTIEYFIKKPNLQLLIRVHPAEVNGLLPSRQKIVDEVKKIYPKLPKNIILIPPESNVSTYAVMSHCDTVIIYNTKTGVELTSMGIPVIVAGEAWIRNKGFTIDVDSPEAYFKVLNKLPLKRRMDDDHILEAKKYAYHFFFRRMIPLEFVEPGKKFYFSIKLSSLKELLPGQSVGLDVICNGILNNTDFIYPTEEILDE